MVSSQRDRPVKLVVDSIHGDVHLTDCELEVVDTGSFQRLRHLKQLAMSQMAYPNATHTRFAHSLGALAIMEKITKIAKESGQIKLSNREEENLRLAALLHDIGFCFFNEARYSFWLSSISLFCAAKLASCCA